MGIRDGICSEWPLLKVIGIHYHHEHSAVKVYDTSATGSVESETSISNPMK